MNRVITIRHEFGGGGRELGRRLADELHCAYHDQEIVTQIAKRTQVAEEYVRRIKSLDAHRAASESTMISVSIPRGSI